jgi:hypothetical protein
MGSGFSSGRSLAPQHQHENAFGLKRLAELGGGRLRLRSVLYASVCRSLTRRKEPPFAGRAKTLIVLLERAMNMANRAR